ncbi:hypothetical protein VB735_08055 [Halotia wernerae UHCC 0503]|nr:hypothetical protein [Halotia wernerae UHCC 0503]
MTLNLSKLRSSDLQMLSAYIVIAYLIGYARGCTLYIVPKSWAKLTIPCLNQIFGLTKLALFV